MKELKCPKANPASLINTWNAFSHYHQNDGAYALADSFFFEANRHIVYIMLYPGRGVVDTKKGLEGEICGSETVEVFGCTKCNTKKTELGRMD